MQTLDFTQNCHSKYIFVYLRIIRRLSTFTWKIWEFYQETFLVWLEYIFLFCLTDLLDVCLFYFVLCGKNIHRHHGLSCVIDLLEYLIYLLKICLLVCLLWKPILVYVGSVTRVHVKVFAVLIFVEPRYFLFNFLNVSTRSGQLMKAVWPRYLVFIESCVASVIWTRTNYSFWQI